jgi:hypothetical protein
MKVQSWLLAAIVVAAVQACAAVRSDLVTDLEGYWRFGGDGGDASGNSRDVSLEGGVGFGDGLFDQALDLPNDVTKYAVRPMNDTAYDFGSGDFTIQLWVNYYSMGAEQVAIEKWSGSGGPGWTLTKLGSNVLRFHLDSSLVIDSYSVPNTPGVWHYWTMRRSGGSLEMRFDNELVASREIGGYSAVPSTNPLLIGRRNAADGRGFQMNGRMDEVAIWRRALSDDEFAYLYNDGYGNPIIPEPSTLLAFALAVGGLVGVSRRRK